jgi:sugar lactone lactonase YvrE
MMKRAAKIWLALGAAALLAACAPSRAAMDSSYSGGIFWPGPPEKPRIMYLWSMTQVAGAEKGRALRLITGDEEDDVEDPRNSSFLVNPHGVFVDASDVMYVAESGSGRVSIVDLKTMESRFLLGGSYFNLLTPIGVVADPQGRVFVTDADLRRVAVFTPKGNFERFLDGDFKRPTGLAMDMERDALYVADTWDHSVQVYGLKDGIRRATIGTRGDEEGKLNYPTHLAVDREGNLYVSDTLNFRIQVFSPEGVLLTAFGVAGDVVGAFDKIKGVAVDSEGHIYISDTAQDMIKIFDRDGRFLLFFGKKGHFYGDFYLPAGIYIDSRDRIYVADSYNRRIQVFQFLGGG